ncbi:MAG: response regulator [Pseudomonadota bacterium]
MSESTKQNGIETSSSVDFLHHVLFVDDDKMIVEIMKSLLPMQEIGVTGYDDPNDALKEFASNHSAYDLLMVDKSMPSLSGLELIQACKEIVPDLPVILFTGHQESSSDMLQYGISEILQKPVKSEVVSGCIKRLLAN